MKCKGPASGREASPIIAKVFIAACLVLPACTRCGHATSTPGAAAVATYATGKVTADELQREANRLPPALREKFATPDGQRELASAMVDKRLLAGEARKRGLSDDPEVRRQVEELEQRLTIQALLAAEEKQAGPPSTEELRAYYETHLQELTTLERARASRILVTMARGDLGCIPKRGALDRKRGDAFCSLQQARAASPVIESAGGREVNWLTPHHGGRPG